ncbi:SDR family NAD(P)-dependent oxidoreductase [Rhizobium leguminosarum]
MYDFTRKTAIITGAGGAISGACARLLHETGANVVIADVNEEAVHSLADELDPTRTTVLAQKQDAGHSEDADALVAAAVAKFGGIDIVIPGAGLYLESPLQTMTNAHWERVIGVNLDGVFFTVRAAIPYVRDGGAIVTLASMAGHKGSFHHGHYATAKGGLLALTRTLALELAPRIRVNAVSPGVIETPMTTEIIQSKGDTLIQQTPMKRFGTAKEVADAVIYLCSDKASFVTGETLHVNGGIYIAS